MEKNAFMFFIGKNSPLESQNIKRNKVCTLFSVTRQKLNLACVRSYFGSFK